MTTLLFHVIAWPTFFMALLVFGFAPGIVLRIIVLAFRKDDPRRRELLGELYSVPRIERPFWVAEKLELAVTEGLGSRVLRLIKDVSLGQRLVNGWHEAKNDILRGTVPTGTRFALFSLIGCLVYICMLLHGSVREAVALSWILVMAVRTMIYDRVGKRCKREGRPEATILLDKVAAIVLSPPICATTAYMLLHDVLVLTSGNMSASYWVGLWLSLYALLGFLDTPFSAKRTARWAARRVAPTDKAPVQRSAH